MKKALIVASILSALPLFASAAVLNNVNDVASLIINFINQIAVPILFAIAFIVFLYGAFQTFILGATSEEVKEKGRNLMIWSVVGFFVMASIWGLVNVLTGTIQFNNNQGPNQVPHTGVPVGGV